MEDLSSQSPKPGWYPDPEVVSGLRYWDGQHWTEQRLSGPGAMSKGTRPPRTLWLAFLLPLVVGVLYWIFISIEWNVCRTDHGTEVRPFYFLLASATLCFLIQGWYRGQKPLILVAQTVLAAGLTVVVLTIVALLVAADHGCFD
jgi:hypothetical protein